MDHLGIMNAVRWKQRICWTTSLCLFNNYYSLMSDYSIKIFWFIHFLLSYICFILWWYRLLVLHGQSGCSFNHRICCCPVRSNINLLLCSPRRNGADKSCFCLSVTYIPNNSRTRRHSVPKFRTQVPHLWCDSHTSFKVKRSRSPEPLMLTIG